MDAVVISIPQMDTISVRLLENKLLRAKLESSDYHFDVIITENEKLTYQLDFKIKQIEDLTTINSELESQIDILKEQLTLTKPNFWQRLSDYILFMGLGFAVGLGITLF